MPLILQKPPVSEDILKEVSFKYIPANYEISDVMELQVLHNDKVCGFIHYEQVSDEYVEEYEAELIEIHQNSTRTFYLQYINIYMMYRKYGLGRILMESFLDRLEPGDLVILNACPIKDSHDHISLRKLIDFYRSLGFLCGNSFEDINAVMYIKYE